MNLKFMKKIILIFQKVLDDSNQNTVVSPFLVKLLLSILVRSLLSYEYLHNIDCFLNIDLHFR